MAKRKPGTNSKSKNNQGTKKPESTSTSSDVDKPEPRDAEEVLAASEAAGVVGALEKNRLYVIGISVAIFAAVCFFLIFKQLGQDRKSKAAQAFTSAAISKDITALDQVVANFGNSVAAGNALLTKADIQIKDGAKQDAISTLSKMASDYTSHPLHSQAYFMLGNLHLQANEFDKAIENYKKVKSEQPKSELALLSGLRIGDAELAKGNSDLAKQSYDEVLSEHGDGNFKEAANQLVSVRKMQIGVTMPKEVPAPEEAEEETVIETTPTPPIDPEATDKPE